MSPKIIHYREKCIGCDTCCMYAPDYWEIDKTDGKARLVRGQEKKKNVFVQDISEAEVAVNKDAANGCPANIICVRDDQGKKIAPQ